MPLMRQLRTGKWVPYGARFQPTREQAESVRKAEALHEVCVRLSKAQWEWRQMYDYSLAVQAAGWPNTRRRLQELIELTARIRALKVEAQGI